MNKTVLKKYAQLIVEKGVNVQKGQEVTVYAELDQPEFVEMVVKAAYKAGAEKVTVEWNFLPVERLHYRYRSLKVLSKVEKWEVEKAEHRAEILPCAIYLESSDPDGMNGTDQEKISKAVQERMKVLKPIRDRMENRYRWVIAAVPGRAWAKKLFPEERPATAVEKLWERILSASRADGADPSADWDAHNADLSSRCRYLNSLGLTDIRIRSANGTDIKIGLIKDSVFMGGCETVIGSDIEYNPNIPSEEVFITPEKGKAEGIVYSTRPFSYRGQVINRFSIRFEGGKAVSAEGETAKETEILKNMISMDEGAAYLGEVAFVPYSSPVRKTDMLFFNTLFDENAACHLALGRGFSNCLKDYEKYTLEQTVEKGINDSIIHEDFMIGAADTSIVGIKENGEEVTLFRDGEWAF